MNDRPTLEGARHVTVVPVASESQLRQRAWVEDNRRKVTELSGGRVAYVWLPNTPQQGYEFFNRYYFAQQDKQGAIIDERWNGGGSAADYMVDYMSRRLTGFFNNPVGRKQPFRNPNAGIFGPKVMIINESVGSGGDLLPYMFRSMGIGPLVGTRTWGGLSLCRSDQVAPERIVGHRQVTDAHLLTLALRRGGQRAIFDQGVADVLPAGVSRESVLVFPG